MDTTPQFQHGPFNQPKVNGAPSIPLSQKIAQVLQQNGLATPPPWPAIDFGDPRQESIIKDFWNTTKQYRAKVRAALMKANLIDDPDKPKKLSDALEFRGTCEDMCPHFEKITRIVEHDVKRAERNGDVPALEKMVKAHSRSSAGQEAPLPQDIRTPAALRRTLDYLVSGLLGASDNELPNVHHFLWDRTRSLRRDFTFQQSSLTPSEMEDQVYCLETITRFHVIALHQLSNADNTYSDFSEHQEAEQLARTLLSLTHAYDDCKAAGVKCKNEAEFRAYYLLYHSGKGAILETAQDWGAEFWETDEFQTAVTLSECLQNHWERRGPLHPGDATPIALNAYSRFFDIVKSPQVSYTMACFAEIKFRNVRKNILTTILSSYRKQRDQTADWTIAELNKYLQFDNLDEVEDFLETYGLGVVQATNGDYLDFTSQTELIEPSPQPKQSFSRNLVEWKRNKCTLPEAIYTNAYGDASQAPLREEESLFVQGERANSFQPKAAPAFQSPVMPNPFAATSAFGTFGNPTPNTAPNPFAAAQANPLKMVGGFVDEDEDESDNSAKETANKLSTAPSIGQSSATTTFGTFGTPGAAVSFPSTQKTESTITNTTTASTSAKPFSSFFPTAASNTASTPSALATSGPSFTTTWTPSNITRDNPVAEEPPKTSFFSFAPTASKPSESSSSELAANKDKAPSAAPPFSLPSNNTVKVIAEESKPAATPSFSFLNNAVDTPDASTQTASKPAFTFPTTTSTMSPAQSRKQPAATFGSTFHAASDLIKSGPVAFSSSFGDNGAAQPPQAAHTTASLGNHEVTEATDQPPVSQQVASTNAAVSPPPPSLAQPAKKYDWLENINPPKPTPTVSKPTKQAKPMIGSLAPLLAEWVALGSGGTVEQFMKDLIEKEVRAAWNQHQDELAEEEEEEGLAREREAQRVEAEVKHFRRQSLSVKYFYRWRENVQILWQRKQGRKERALRREMAERSLRASLLAEAEKAEHEAAIQNFTASIGRKSVTKRKSSEELQEEMLAASGVLNGIPDSAKKIRMAARGDMLPPPTPKAKPRSTTPAGSPAATSLKRSHSQHVDLGASTSSLSSLLNASVRSPSGARGGSPASASSAHSRSLSESSARRSKVTAQDIAMGGSRIGLIPNYNVRDEDRLRRSTSGVQTDYFRLKALGVQPYIHAGYASRPGDHLPNGAILDNLNRTFSSSLMHKRPKPAPVADPLTELPRLSRSAAKRSAHDLQDNIVNGESAKRHKMLIERARIANNPGLAAAKKAEEDKELEEIKARARRILDENRAKREKEERHEYERDAELEDLLARSRRIRQEMEEGEKWYQTATRSLSRDVSRQPSTEDLRGAAGMSNGFAMSNGSAKRGFADSFGSTASGGSGLTPSKRGRTPPRSAPAPKPAPPMRPPPQQQPIEIIDLDSD
jgi:hypothetical protein